MEVVNVKKISQNKLSYIFLLLIVTLSGILLYFDMKLGLIEGSVRRVIRHIDDYMFDWLQFDIQQMVYDIVDIISLILIVVFSIISVFKSKIIKVIGITMIFQNIILLSLRAWYQFFTNGIDTFYIDIKLYLVIDVITTLIITYLSIVKSKIFDFALGCITIVQTIISIYYINNYIGMFRIIDMFHFYCNQTVILILYWIVLFLTKREIKVSTKESKSSKEVF